MRTILPLLTFTLLIAPFLAFGQNVEYTYRPLVTIQGVPLSGWQEYVDFLYASAISLAALLAVIKIVVAGAKYMFTDVITSKGEAKKDIIWSLGGLLLIIGAVIILEVINPRLTQGNIQFQKVQTDTPVAPTPGIQPAAPTGNAPAVPIGGATSTIGAQAPTASTRCGTSNEIIVTPNGSQTNTNYAICTGITAQELIDTCKASPNYRTHIRAADSVTCVEKAG